MNERAILSDRTNPVPLLSLRIFTAMANTIELNATDGHHLAAYLAEPIGKPRGAVVVVQEIFGVTRHIRDVADQYAAAGYLAIAPALFDRVERNVDVPYTDFPRAIGYMNAMNKDLVMLDLGAAIARVSKAGKVGMVGYCWGGAMTYLAAARLNIAAAVAYYGGGINTLLAEKPRVPVLFHFGEKDTHIPLSAVDAIKAAYPEGTYYIYPADHGFNCTHRPSFNAESALLALARSLEFFYRNLG
jgi:carboxymethylenebutenolidase